MKPSYYTVAAVLLSLLFSSPCGATNWQRVKADAGKLDSIQANFVQEKHMKILAKPITSTGRFFFRKPASIRWEYDTPIRSTLLMYNGTIKHFVQGEKGVEETPGQQLQPMQFVMQEIGNWMKGQFDKSTVFKSELGDNRKIVLTPKNKTMSRFIQKIEITLGSQPGVIDTVMIYESSHSFTKLSFSNVVPNKPLPDDLFKGL